MIRQQRSWGGGGVRGSGSPATMRWIPEICTNSMRKCVGVPRVPSAVEFSAPTAPRLCNRVARPTTGRLPCPMREREHIPQSNMCRQSQNYGSTTWASWLVKLCTVIVSVRHEKVFSYLGCFWQRNFYNECPKRRQIWAPKSKSAVECKKSVSFECNHCIRMHSNFSNNYFSKRNDY
jgi:hypothetical protein